MLVTADRESGVVGTTFSLSAVVAGVAQPVGDVQWDFGDGRTDSGNAVQVQFATPGLYSVVASTAQVSGSSLQSSLLLVVQTAPGQPPVAPGGIALPALIGDVDGDGMLTLVDAHSVLKHVRGLEYLIGEMALRAADFDQNGHIEQLDVDLLGRALAGAAATPSALLPGQGAPGVRVQILSSELEDMSRDVRIQVGQSAVQSLFRLVPGRATFLVPLDAGGPAGGAIAAGPTPVRLFVGTDIVEELTFDLVDPGTPTGDPLVVITGALDSLEVQLQNLHGVLATYLGSVGADQQSAAVLDSLLSLASSRLAQADPALRNSLRAMDPATRTLFYRAALANGLDKAIQTGARLAGGIPEGSASTNLIATLCAASAVVEMADTIDDALGTACSAIALLALIPQPLQPAIAGLAAACSGISIATDFVEVVSAYIPDVGDKLRVSASPAILGAGEVATVTARLPIEVAELLCDNRVEGLVDQLKERLLRRLLARIPVTRLASLVIRGYPLEERTNELRRDILDAIQELVESLLGDILDLIGIDGALERLQNTVCGLFSGLNPSIALDPSTVTFTLDPPDAATLLVNGGVATLTCNASSASSTVTITASAPTCDDEDATGTATVQCNTTNDVQFCIGDNGSALDDIYELRVDGASVLTSSVPVRNICTMQTLTSGTHQVQMVGLAAPDGVGTYFLTISGAQIQSGPSLSGSDLTAGSVFTWSILVP